MIIADIKDRERYFALHEKMEQLWEYVLSHDLAHEIGRASCRERV